MRPTGLLVAAGLLMGACAIFGPDEERDVRVIGFIDNPDIDFVVPDSAAVGQAFTVTVFTHRGHNTRIGETEVSIEGNVAVVIPYDYVEYVPPGSAIPADLHSFEHQATIQFNATGEAQVILRATDSFVSLSPIELTRVVQVY